MGFVSALELLDNPDRFKVSRKAEPEPDFDAILDEIAVDFLIVAPRGHRAGPRRRDDGAGPDPR